MIPAVETFGLTKSFGDLCAVDNVSLRVEPGEIYGFLGRNGAGKTTTIRALLGMIRPSAGSVKLLGEPIGPNGRGPWRRVGHLVERPSAYPELTVRENLEIARRLHGIRDKDSGHRVVELMGLDVYANRKAGALSTGNRLRLGLARALLPEPELLILDEPASGLDPAGVVEIRELLARLSREHSVAVFMSSHILTEVDRLATRIGIIHEGRLIEELEADRLEALRSRRLAVRTRDLGAARAALGAAGFDTTVSGDTLLLTDARAIETPDDVATALVGASTPPTHLAVEQEELEAHFLRLTGDQSWPEHPRGTS